MPIDGRELALINKNAWQVWKRIMAQGKLMGFTEQAIEKAIKDNA